MLSGYECLLGLIFVIHYLIFNLRFSNLMTVKAATELCGRNVIWFSKNNYDGCDLIRYVYYTLEFCHTIDSVLFSFWGKRSSPLLLSVVIWFNICLLLSVYFSYITKSRQLINNRIQFIFDFIFISLLLLLLLLLFNVWCSSSSRAGGLLCTLAAVNGQRPTAAR